MGMDLYENLVDYSYEETTKDHKFSSTPSIATLIQLSFHLGEIWNLVLCVFLTNT